MMQYLKLQLTYILNRYIVTIIMIFILFLLFGLLYNSGMTEGYQYLDMYKLDYQRLFMDDSIELIKISGVIVAILLAAISGSKGNMNLAKYTVQSQPDRIKFGLGRLVAISIVIALLVTIYWLAYLIIGLYLTPFDLNIQNTGKIYGYLFLQILEYAFFTMIIVMIFQSFFVIIIPIILFWVIESNAYLEKIQTTDWLKYLNQIFCNVARYGENYGFAFDIYNYLIVIFVLLVSYFLLTSLKDLN